MCVPINAFATFSESSAWKVNISGTAFGNREHEKLFVNALSTLHLKSCNLDCWQNSKQKAMMFRYEEIVAVCQLPVNRFASSASFTDISDRESVICYFLNHE